MSSKGFKFQIRSTAMRVRWFGVGFAFWFAAMVCGGCAAKREQWTAHYPHDSMPQRGRETVYPLNCRHIDREIDAECLIAAMPLGKNGEGMLLFVIPPPNAELLRAHRNEAFSVRGNRHFVTTIDSDRAGLYRTLLTILRVHGIVNEGVFPIVYYIEVTSMSFHP